MWVCPVVHATDDIYIDDQYQEALGFMLVYETKALAEVHAAGLPVVRLHRDPQKAWWLRVLDRL